MQNIQMKLTLCIINIVIIIAGQTLSITSDSFLWDHQKGPIKPKQTQLRRCISVIRVLKRFRRYYVRKIEC